MIIFGCWVAGEPLTGLSSAASAKITGLHYGGWRIIDLRLLAGGKDPGLEVAGGCTLVRNI